MRICDIYEQQRIVGALLAMDEAKDHHPMGGSSLYRRVKCPASAIAEQIDGTSTESSAASKGTFIHGEIESAINVGDIGTANPHVLNAIAYVDRIRDNHSDVGIYAEQRVKLLDDDGSILSFGTIDFLAIDGRRHGMVRDWKTGSGWETCYEAQKYQLRSYVASAILKYDLISCDGATVETGTGTEGLEVLTRDRQWALEFRKDFKALKAKVYTGEAEFAPCTGDYCQYCKVGERGSRMCPVLQMEDKFAADVVGLEIPEPMPLAILDDCDRRLIAAKQVIKACQAIIAAAEKPIIEAGGSTAHKVQAGYEYGKTDWKKVIDDIGIVSIDPEIVARNTKTITVEAQVRERKDIRNEKE